jgi:threonine synthase
MIFYSTNNSNIRLSFKDAVLQGIASDKGLFYPSYIPTLPQEFFDNIENLSLQEIAFEVAKQFIGDEMPNNILKNIVNESLNFPIPAIKVTDNIYSLELFHGPTCAFKDVGARFMARCFNYFLNEGEKQTILVATSGDTGSAVANGFLGIDNINVIVLYPKGKVSDIQESQFTTLGKNITAIKIDGSFDDCQAMVKEAFLDHDLTDHINLSSANSINIARLLPQSFYYFYAYAQLKKLGKPLNICVPSGNFGNLTGALFAKKMGLPINNFIAALNSNRVFLDYLNSGNYEAKPSIQTIANAMDVGDPSNFVRVQEMFHHSLKEVKNEISSYSYSDNEIFDTVKRVNNELNYTLDPHGATGFLASEEYIKNNTNEISVFVETAHPAKFKETVENAINCEIEIPENLKKFMDKEKSFFELSNQYTDFKTFLLENK